MSVSLVVNGEPIDALRLAAAQSCGFPLGRNFKLTGTHGRLRARRLRRLHRPESMVRSFAPALMLTVQAQGASVETIEGLSDSGEIADLQAAFRERNALRCGYCTPGDADDGTGLAEPRT